MRIIIKLVLSALIVLLCLTGCHLFKASKTISLMKSGEVAQKEFNVTIPFEYRLGLIVLKVSIAGNEYDFVFDTGTPNIISVELAKKLGVDKTLEIEVEDSQEKKSNLGIVKIEQIEIGDIDFLNTGATIADLSSSNPMLACLKIDGFIGSNLMRKAIWKIDYEHQKITLTNSMNNLNVSETAEKVKFEEDFLGKPKINIKLDNVVAKNITVDLGSNGHIKVSKDDLNKLSITNPGISKVASFGTSSYGLYGIGNNDSTFKAIVPQISFGDILLKNTIVGFIGKSKSKIGNKFFKNYDLVFNWFNNEIILTKKQDYDYTAFSSYGFITVVDKNNLIISEIYENSSAYNEGLKLGDQIFQIDNVKYDNLSDEEACGIFDKGLGFKGEEISITVLRNGEELNFVLKRKKLL